MARFLRLSCKCSSSLMDEPMLMKLYTVAVYTLRMCMKEDNPGSNYFKGDNKLCGTEGIHL